MGEKKKTLNIFKTHTHTSQIQTAHSYLFTNRHSWSKFGFIIKSLPEMSLVITIIICMFSHNKTTYLVKLWEARNAN